jgi:hypothetical protein
VLGVKPEEVWVEWKYRWTVVCHNEGGAGATALKSDKNVVIHLLPKTTGANLKLAGEGVKFTLEKKK